MVVGGIGFIVWNDIAEYRFQIRKYRLHSKIVLSATLVLIFVSTIAFCLLEWHQAYAGLATGEKLLASLFSAVTARTAGFFTVQIPSMSEAGSILTMILMLIGAGPGSTAGGIKITTIAVIFLSTIGYIKGSDDINIFGRRIDQANVRHAFNMAFLYILIATIGGFIIIIIQMPICMMMFEVFRQSAQPAVERANQQFIAAIKNRHHPAHVSGRSAVPHRALRKETRGFLRILKKKSSSDGELYAISTTTY